MPFTTIGICIIIAFTLSYIKARSDYRPPIFFAFFSSLFLVFYGMMMMNSKRPSRDKFHYVNHYKAGELLRVSIMEELKHNDYYFKYRGEIKGIGRNKTRGNILIRISKNEENKGLNLNHDIFTYQRFSELRSPMNPGAFDFKEYMRRKGVYHQITLDKDDFVPVKTSRNSLKKLALMHRDQILQSLNEKEFPKEEFSVIEALILGRKTDLSNEMVLNYQNAGAMHLLAISGLHIGILLMILNMTLKPMMRFKYGKNIKLLILIIFLWFFAFLSGLSASVVRAVFMFTVLSIGLYSGRKNNIGQYVFTALFFSLIINPYYLFDLGFLLSYTAVISIIVLSPLIRSSWNPKNKIIKYLWNLMAVSLSAQLGVLPISLYYFHQFSALFFLSSLCIIPFLGIILGMGYFMIVLNYIDYLPIFYIRIYTWMIKMMNQIIEILGGLKYLIYRDVFFSLALLFFSYMLIAFFISWLRAQSVKRTMALLISIIFLATSFLVEKKLTLSSNAFIVFHQYNQSMVLQRLGRKARAYGSFKNEDPIRTRFLDEYRLEHMTLDIEETKKKKHFFRVGEEQILIIDHQLIDSNLGFKPDILILMNSPKINLERLLTKIHPRIIVVDGSNFYSYKFLWQRTAEKQDIIFHDTSKMGAFALVNST